MKQMEMSEQRQEQVRERLENLPVKQFGNRELAILRGQSREIEEETNKKIGEEEKTIYRMESSGGVCSFYFERDGITFVN